MLLSTVRVLFISIAEVTIEFAIHTDFPAERYFRLSASSNSRGALKALLTRDSLIIETPKQSAVNLNIPFFMRDSPSGPTDFIRKYLAYFASLYKSGWDLVHGAGLEKNQRGILLLGRSGAGKTTICQSMTDCRIIEDDTLLLNQGRMYWIGKCGIAELPNENKTLTLLHNSIEGVSVYCFFLLSKRIEGGKCHSIKPKDIPRRLSVPDFIPQHHLIPYLTEPPIPLNATGYVLGTQGNLHATLDLIRKLSGVE